VPSLTVPVIVATPAITPPGGLQSWTPVLMPVAATPSLPAATLARRSAALGRSAETVASTTAVAAHGCRILAPTRRGQYRNQRHQAEAGSEGHATRSRGSSTSPPARLGG
jgi:hypothetical protein